MNGSAPLVEGEFGEGAYGATILLKLKSAEGAEYLKAIFDRLAASEPGASLRLSDDPGVVLDAGSCSLQLRVVGERRHRRLVSSSRSTLSRRPAGVADEGFTWTGTSYDWETVALLVEPLCEAAGHQYLTSDVDDEAVVEVLRS